MRPDLRTYLLSDDGNRVFGPGPADVLASVDRLGSLRAAAIEMGMAYTKATQLVHAAEDALGFRLTERTVGGANGGGSVLTPAACDVLRRYRAFERVSREALERSYAACFAGSLGTPRLGCVIMAAGPGKRFGGVPGSKLFAELADVPVLMRTIRSVPREVYDLVVVSASDRVHKMCEELDVPWVVPAGSRKADTMRAGLSALGMRAGCLFLPGDQPLVRPESFRALANVLVDEPSAIARLGYGETAAGPVLWPGDLLGALAELDQESGGRAMLEGHVELGGRVRVVEALEEAEIWDIDRAADIDKLEAALAAREGKA